MYFNYEYLDEFIVVYLNDAVIYNEFLDDHICHLKKVFYRSREHQLFIKLGEYDFALHSIKFLGHLMS